MSKGQERQIRIRQLGLHKYFTVHSQLNFITPKLRIFIALYTYIDISKDWLQQRSCILLRIRMRIFASRQCADYARASYMWVQVRHTWHMTFAVEAVWCL